ncbi:MAG: hypothetical protein KC492_14045 [Myxococcales bacterium]|nr:hypothetical protein [Myxococcales bacterium]
MRIDRERFLWLTAALSGCHSGGAVGEPTNIVIAAPTPPKKHKKDDGDLPEAAGNSLAARCAKLRAIEPEEGEVAPYGIRSCQLVGELCEHMAEELLPSVAERGISCLEDLSPACDACSMVSCTTSALESLEPSEVRECDDIGPSSEGYTDEYLVDTCKRYASGMNTQGRKRFAACMAENRYMGVRFCLWDTQDNPCYSGYPSYE